MLHLMGNQFRRMASEEPSPPPKYQEPVENFKFLEPFAEESTNGLYLNDVYLPEEVVIMILSYVDPKQLLKVSEVCKKWCNIIKSDTFMASIYHRQYQKKPKKLPWYVYYCALSTNYFDKNLIKNGNGEEEFKHWKIVLNYGDAFRIENPPCGADPLPLDIPDFNGKRSCFATSYYECNKLQEISLKNSRLMQLIFNEYKPHIYLSEWVAGRFDCGCVYTLWCKLFGSKYEVVRGKQKSPHLSNFEECDDSHSSDESDPDQPLHVAEVGTRFAQWEGRAWSKLEMVVQNYPSGIERIVFQHEGRDTQFWKGHYGSKMAGGVLKMLFDSIEPLK